MRAIAFVLLAVCLPAKAADWETTDKWLLGSALGAMAIDWAQTRDLATKYHETYATPACADPSTRGFALAGPCPATRQYDHSELNPLLPKHPTVGQVDRYFAVAMLGTAGLAYVLHARYRRHLLGTVLVLESMVVLHNHSIGLRASF